MVQTAPVPPVSPVHAPFEVRLEEVFRHILRHMQGRIRTDIPASAIDAVLQACAQRAATRETITPAMVHAILRHLSRTAGRPFSDFRRHVYQVCLAHPASRALLIRSLTAPRRTAPTPPNTT